MSLARDWPLNRGAMLATIHTESRRDREASMGHATPGVGRLREPMAPPLRAAQEPWSRVGSGPFTGPPAARGRPGPRLLLRFLHAALGMRHSPER